MGECGHGGVWRGAGEVVLLTEVAEGLSLAWPGLAKARKAHMCAPV